MSCASPATLASMPHPRVPVPHARTPVLHGRATELEALCRLAGGALLGSGGALLLLGDPGTGKSALLEAFASVAASPIASTAADTGAGAGAEGAGGFVVLRVRGTQTEEHLPYAGLHALLRPIAAGLAALPRPRPRFWRGCWSWARPTAGWRCPPRSWPCCAPWTARS
nr:hypothetical protein GCM10020093_024350 [Planobispora longispora]